MNTRQTNRTSEQERQAASGEQSMRPERTASIEETLRPDQTAPFDLATQPDQLSPSDISPPADEVGPGEDDVFEVNPDFTDQRLETVSNDDFDPDIETVFPPTDPVVGVDERGRTEVVGGFSATSLDATGVARSSDGRLGDEAIADAIRRELREDALTTDLEIEVLVQQGVATLRGTVTALEEAEQAEMIASNVPGVEAVREELEVSGI